MLLFRRGPLSIRTQFWILISLFLFTTLILAQQNDTETGIPDNCANSCDAVSDVVAGTAPGALAQASSNSDNNGLIQRRQFTKAAPRAPDDHGLCMWTRCGGPCPEGMSAAVAVLDGCPQSSSGPVLVRQFCCPSNDMPSCGARFAGKEGDRILCGPSACPEGFQLLTTSQYLFGFREQACGSEGNIKVCCSRTPSLTRTVGQCTWTECDGSCPLDTISLTETLHGDGGDQPCSSGTRKLCCPTAGGSVFLSATCAWHHNGLHGTCTPGCPQSQVQLAIDYRPNCPRGGFSSFCCDPPINALAGRSDPLVHQFEEEVYFLIREWEPETCSAGSGLGRRQKSPSSFSFSNFLHSLALILWAYKHSPHESQYTNLHKEVWNQQVEDGSNLFPTWDELAEAIYGDPRDGRNVSPRLQEMLCEGVQDRENSESNNRAMTDLCTEFQVGSGPIIRVGGFRGPRKDRSSQSGTDHAVIRKSETYTTKDERTQEKEEYPSSTESFDALSELAKRTIRKGWTPGTSNDNSTTVGDALQAAVSGELRLEYFRWFPYHGGSGGDASLGPEIELEAVFLLGTDPRNIRADLQGGNRANHYMVVHVHFSSGGTPDNSGIMTISQINVRHARRIRNMEAPDQSTRPGSYQIIQNERFGCEAFKCRPSQHLRYQTGVDPTRPLSSIPPPPATGPNPNLQSRLVLQLLHMMSRWGTNGNLFYLGTPDASHIYRTRRGPNTGQPVGGGAGHSMFDANTARYIETLTGQLGQGLAFHPNGTLYTPSDDIMKNPDFYQS